MTEYASNSHKSKEPSKKAKSPEKFDKVVNGGITTRKKSGAKKFFEDFLVKDFDSVKDYAINDIILPSVKKGLYDLFTGSLNMLFFGDSSSRDYGNRGSGIPARVSYDRFYSGDNSSKNNRPVPRRASNGYSYDDIVFNDRGDAQVVLERMDEIISRYGLISVASMYDLAGITAETTDHKYGWTDIRSASIMSERGGYVIRMPRALPLD